MRNARNILVIILALLLITSVCWAIDGFYTHNKYNVIVQPGQVHSAQNTWVVIDSTLIDDEPSDLAVGERTYATVVAAIAAAANDDQEISIYGDDAAEILNVSSWNLIRFRCIGETNEQDVVYQIYLGTLGIGGTDCELVKAGQLAFVIGTQASTTSGYEMADAVTVTNYCWTKSWGTASPSGNLSAEAAIDILGADIIVAVPTTANCACKLLAKGL